MAAEGASMLSHDTAGIVFNLNVSTNCYDPSQWRGIVLARIKIQRQIKHTQSQIDDGDDTRDSAENINRGKSSRKMLKLRVSIVFEDAAFNS